MRCALRFQPIYQSRVWGGRHLHQAFGRTLPADVPVGESWEIVDRVEAQSIVSGGPFSGFSLRQLMVAHGPEVMGPSWPVARNFPILVKWLDCRERLSLQVHPPAAVALELGGEPKTENWFIAHCSKGAELTVGLKNGVDRGQFLRALEDQTVDRCVHHFPVNAGDSILVRSGQVHAIGGGNLVLEIQQNSDTTYRVYDWGRLGLDGKPRQMHVAESLRSIDWLDFEPTPIRASSQSSVIADCAEFRISRRLLAAGEQLQFSGFEQPRLLSLVSGSLSLEGAGHAGSPIHCGENLLLPYAANLSFSATEASTLLITEGFANP